MKKVSEHYNIDLSELKKRDVFDSIIGTDNPYFFDPSLLPFTEAPEFDEAREQLQNYFKKVIALIKTKRPTYFQQAVNMLKQPDLKGASTGYGESDDGAGVGPKLARILACNARDLIESGNEDPILFEIIGMFTPDFGPDRMGDLINGILRKNIYRFTERIARELDIKCTFEVKFEKETFILPIHPLSNNKPILFFPESVLAPLPIALSWGDVYEAAVLNQETRDRFNEFLKPLFEDSAKPEKEKFKEYLLSKDTNERTRALIDVYKAVEPSVYDFEKDPAGKYRWYEDAKEILNSSAKPEIKEAKTLKDLMEAVEEVTKYFKHAIETHLWKHSYEQDGNPRHESYFQSIFLMLAQPLCDGKNIDLAPESNKGRGPVDFKLSRGKANVTVEMKLTSNTRLLKGFEVQLPIYSKAEKSKHAYFVVVITNKTSSQLDAVEKIVNEDKSGNITLYTVSALPKESASKAKEVD